MARAELREIIDQSQYKNNLRLLADELGYCVRTIQYWISGKSEPCSRDMIILAEKLNVPVERIVKIFGTGVKVKPTAGKKVPYKNIYIKDKVILGLQCCGAKQFKCKKCPYEHYGMKSCTIQLCNDALYVISGKGQPKQEE